MPIRLIVVLFAMFSTNAFAQTAPLASREVATPADSGWVENSGATSEVLWTYRIRVPDAPWIRLRFADVRLGRIVDGESAAYLRMTSVADGAIQTMHARHVGQWRKTSAYFNGDAVDIEIVADAASGPCRVVIDTTTAGIIAGSVRNLCGDEDDRVPSTDPRAARIVPVGCTGWLINDANFCQLTAGHCVVSGTADVIEFNVPPSTATGAIVHPPPSDQYAMDPDSLQYTPGIIEVGEDWAYYGVFENSTTSLTPYEAQGDRYALAEDVPPPNGQILRKTGFGSTSSGVPPSYNLAQKTLTGPFINQFGTRLAYLIDSSGGDSGSPVFLDGTDIAYAIHTNGGCNTVGFNSGTSLENADLQAALANPTGVCIPHYFNYDYPNGRPVIVDTTGSTTTRITITTRNLYEVAANSGLLHYNHGGGWLTAPIQSVAAGEWDIVFPPMPCGQDLQYYISFETTSGAMSSDPLPAPEMTYSALTGDATSLLAAYDFEAAPGWFVSSQELTGGAWALGTPTGTGLFGEPTQDYDGSGRCYLTGVTAEGDDVDGGPTRLWSPGINMSGAGIPVIQYARWFTNNNQDGDRLRVELSNNSVTTFIEIEAVTDTDGWVERNVFVKDYFPDPGTIRIRFSVSDNPNDSRTEAAIDAVRFLDLTCPACLKGDTTDDGLVDGRDITGFAAALLNPPPTGSDLFCVVDIDGDGTLSATADVTGFVDCLLGAGCP